MKQFMPSLFILLLGITIFTTGCGGSQGEQSVAQAAPPEEPYRLQQDG